VIPTKKKREGGKKKKKKKKKNRERTNSRRKRKSFFTHSHEGRHSCKTQLRKTPISRQTSFTFLEKKKKKRRKRGKRSSLRCAREGANNPAARKKGQNINFPWGRGGGNMKIESLKRGGKPFVATRTNPKIGGKEGRKGASVLLPNATEGTGGGTASADQPSMRQP